MGERVKGADDVCSRIVSEGVAPHAAAGLVVRGGVRGGAGGATSGAGSRAEELGGAHDRLFDLASVTKSFVALAAAHAEGGRLLDVGLAEVLPEVRGSFLERAPLERLLAHRAGLEAHVAVYGPVVDGRALGDGEALERVLAARRPDVREDVGREDAAPVYSDLGYWLVGEALARVTGQGGLEAALARHVLGPLGVEDEVGSARALRARGVGFDARVVPTEHVRWRGGEIRGSVHDENAFVLSGDGVSGHAGLFGTARGVLALGTALLDALAGAPSPLDGALVARLARPRPGGTLRAGFDGKSPSGSAAGERAGPATFGHLGFTGTSLFVDPDASAAVVLLTNRVCPTRENVAIRAARPWAHDALFARAAALARW